MCSAEERADRLTARLTTAGFTPRRQDDGEHLVVLAQVPKSLSAESWQELYELLATADRWALENRRGGLTALAFISKTPATRKVVRGHGPSALGS